MVSLAKPSWRMIITGILPDALPMMHSGHCIVGHDIPALVKVAQVIAYSRAGRFG